MNSFWEELAERAPVTVATALLGIPVWFFGDLCLRRWWQWRASRRLREAAAEYAKQHAGELEVALVLSVREDIRQAAQGYLDQLGRQGIQVFQVHQQEGFDDREESWFAYLERIKKEVRSIRELGAVRVFLFANLPVALSLMAGTTLTNGPEVVVHHFASGRYLPVGRLTTASVRL